MALKEVNDKEAPEAEMTQEEFSDFQDIDDAFVLTQAEKNAADNPIKDLDTSQTEVKIPLMFILDYVYLFKL